MKKGVELYVQNIYVEDEEMQTKKGDPLVVKMVSNYAKAKSIKILGAYVVRNRYRMDMVGCKIRVPESQALFATHESIWPEDVVCGKWYPNRRRRRYQGYYHEESNDAHEQQR